MVFDVAGFTNVISHQDGASPPPPMPTRGEKKKGRATQPNLHKNSTLNCYRLLTIPYHGSFHQKDSPLLQGDSQWQNCLELREEEATQRERSV